MPRNSPKSRRSRARRTTMRRNPGNASQRPITNSGSNASSSLRPLSLCSIPNASGPFADSYFATFKTVIETGLNGSATSSQSYHINSPAFSFGPQVNWTGAFANNFPSGLSYLLGSNVPAGSPAPYHNCTTLDYDWSLDLTNATAVAAYITLVPSLSSSLSSMTSPTLGEQRGAVQILIPPGTLIPLRMRSTGKIHELFGVSSTEISNALPAYSQTSGITPTSLAFMHIVGSSIDGTTPVIINFRMSVFLRLRLSGINPWTTTAPS